MAEMIPEDQGHIVLVDLGIVPAGTDPVFVMPDRVRWRLKSVQGILTTGVNVADRIPELSILFGANEVLRITASQLLAASGVFIFGWMEGERALAVAGQTSRVTALPRNFLLNNAATIQIITTAIDPADVWTDVFIVAEEWIEPL